MAVVGVEAGAGQSLGSMESESANNMNLKIFDFEQNTVDPDVSPEYTTSCCAQFIAEEIAEFSGCQN
eukprot:3541323-Pyramimonas_sp.AAC.1